MKLHYTLRNILIGIILLFAIASCSPEKKLAQKFASSTNSKNILVLSPDYIYKVNLKTYLLDSLEIKDDDNKDSLLLVHSKYLSKLNDSVFVANYLFGYKKGLSSFGFKIFDEEQIEDFLTIDSNSFQVNIAQIELEETLYTYRNEMMIYDAHYYHDHNLNAVYVNSWFEIFDLNAENTMPQIYFATDMITDMAEGTFDYDIFSNKVRYMYNLDSLELDVLYDFAYRLGTEYAAYTFDILLNTELNSKLDPSVRSSKYWRFDPIYHYFYPATDDKFIPLDK